MVAQGCFKFPLNQNFWEFQAAIMDFSTQLKFLVNLQHFVERYEARKDEEPIWSEKCDRTA